MYHLKSNARQEEVASHTFISNHQEPPILSHLLISYILPQCYYNLTHFTQGSVPALAKCVKPNQGHGEQCRAFPALIIIPLLLLMPEALSCKIFLKH